MVIMNNLLNHMIGYPTYSADDKSAGFAYVLKISWSLVLE